MRQAVERPADRRRRPELGMDDDHVLRSRGVPPELGKHAAKRIAWIRAAYVWQDVTRAAEGVVTLLEPELAEVPGDRRLGNTTARVGERVEELELRPDAFARDDARDQ